MPPAHDLEISVRVHLGQAGAHLPRQKPLGEGKVQMREHLDIGKDALCMRRDLVGQRLQNTGNFLLLPRAELL